MKTASGKAPAAQTSLLAPRDGQQGLISATEAARRVGVGHKKLIAAIEAGRIRTVRRGRRYWVNPRELDEDLAALPTCDYVDCREKAWGASGGCEAHGHTLAGPMRAGIKRPPEV